MTGGTAGRPVIALAMVPGLEALLFTAEHWARLEAVGTVAGRTPLARFDDAADVLATVDVLLTGWGCPVLTTEVLDAAPRLRLVAHAAGTVRDFVAPFVLERGVRVSTAADANAIPVAEYAVAAILFAGKGVFLARERYRATREPPLLLTGRVGNNGAVIGIVGASRIGRRVIERLRPYDLELLVSDPYLDPAEAERLGVRAVSLHELLRRSDVVSLHAPATGETRGMLGAAELALLRDGATLVNTARGSLVDPAALEAELVSGRINAVLDVTEPPRPAPDSPLFDLPNVFLTPHIAGSGGNELHRLADAAVSEIERFCARGELAHEVTPAVLATMTESAYG